MDSMNENSMNLGPKPIENKKYTTPTKEQEGVFNQWMKDHPYEEIPMEMRRDYEKEKVKLETLLAEFEKNHSLEELNSITDFPIENTEKNRIRTAAKNDLVPIVALLNVLRGETNITQSEHDKLKAAYKILSRAVGMVNAGKVDHTR